MKKGTVETIVGLFMLLGFGAFLYLALQLGEVSFLSAGRTYLLNAEFDNVAGIKKGASVQIAGVEVGSVEQIRLTEDQFALLAMRFDKSLQIPLDSIASVKSQGIIGDRYIQISLGGDDEYFKPGELLTDTESALDIESLISKFAFGSTK